MTSCQSIQLGIRYYNVQPFFVNQPIVCPSLLQHTPQQFNVRVMLSRKIELACACSRTPPRITLTAVLIDSITIMFSLFFVNQPIVCPSSLQCTPQQFNVRVMLSRKIELACACAHYIRARVCRKNVCQLDLLSRGQ